MNLKPSTLSRIETVIPRYAQKRSALLPLLHLIQEDQGYISKAAMEWIAQKLDLPPIQVLETLTFYPMFRQHPIGKTHIKVCRTLSCHLLGADKTCQTFQDAFNTRLNEISPDGTVTIEYVECLANCDKAPTVMINETLHNQVTPEKAVQLAGEIKENHTKNPTHN